VGKETPRGEMTVETSGREGGLLFMDEEKGGEVFDARRGGFPSNRVEEKL